MLRLGAVITVSARLHRPRILTEMIQNDEAPAALSVDEFLQGASQTLVKRRVVDEDALCEQPSAARAPRLHQHTSEEDGKHAPPGTVRFHAKPSDLLVIALH